MPNAPARRARSGGATISPKVGDDTGYAPGQALQAHFLPADASVFDATTGERV